ncbi:AsmA family protein [candidate division KSB1 bacterium]|nr:AsmA family protein [candidate division KSB1 bacterium]
MKKIIIILGILVLLFITVMIVVPIIFKPQLVALVKKEANKNINATLDFESIGLNLFSSFPNISLKIKHLTLINKTPFEGDTLARISTFKSTIDLMSLIKGKTVMVISIVLDKPQIHLVALKDGTANWNIVKIPEKQKPEPVTQVKSDIKFMLHDYEIKNGTVLYDDQSTGLHVIADHLAHKGSGDFTLDHFQVVTSTKIDELSVGCAGIDYLTKIKTQLKADMDITVKDKKLTLKENELQLNQLILTLDGFITMLGEEIITDLKFKTNQNDLKNILSLIPVIYKNNFADITTSGQAVLQGTIEGAYYKDHYPAFYLQLSINDGMFQYPQSISQVNHIDLDLDIHHPGGILDNTFINLKKCHAEINQEPLDVTLQIKTPVSDPYFSATAKGTANLLDIKNIIPSEKGTDLSGFVSSDLFIDGNLSSIQNNQYNRYQAQGHLSFKDIYYSGPAMPAIVTVQQANLEFTPEKVSLNNFQALLGKGDIHATGSLDDVLPYVLKGQTLKGHLTINSTFFDLNPWLVSPGQQLTAFELPARIDITSNSTFKQVLFGKLKMTEVSGMLAIKDKMLHLIDLNMNVLNGSLVANGTYGKLKDNPAFSFFGLKASHFSINEVFQNFLTVRKFIPIAKNIQGNFDANLEFVTDLDSTLTPVFRTMNSTGSLMIQKVLIENFKPLDIVADILKMEKLRKLAVENIEPSYTIREGRLNLAPLNFKVDNTEYMVAGSNGIDMSMDYLMKLKIPARGLNNQTNAVINNIFKKKLDLLHEDYVVLDVFFKGTVDKPDVNVSGSEIVKGATGQLIDIAKQEILKQKVILPDTVITEIERQKLVLQQLKNLFKKKK